MTLPMYPTDVQYRTDRHHEGGVGYWRKLEMRKDAVIKVVSRRCFVSRVLEGPSGLGRPSRAGDVLGMGWEKEGEDPAGGTARGTHYWEGLFFKGSFLHLRVRFGQRT